MRRSAFGVWRLAFGGAATSVPKGLSEGSLARSAWTRPRKDPPVGYGMVEVAMRFVNPGRIRLEKARLYFAIPIDENALG